MNITIKPELKALIPPLAEDERKQLEQNLIADGCREPLVVWQHHKETAWCKDCEKEQPCSLGDGNVECDVCQYGVGPWPDSILIDGHNRLEICDRNGIKYEVTHKHFDSEVDVRIWMRENQMGRRNLIMAWRVHLHLENEKDRLLVEGDAKYRATVGRPRKEKSLLQNNNDLPKHNTQKEVAKAAGVSPGTVAQAEQVKKNAPELWEKAKQGDVSISAAYTQVRRQVKEEEREARREENRQKIQASDAPTDIISTGAKFATILVDPPWDWGDEGDKDQLGRARPDYSTMSLDELLKLPLSDLSDDDCHIYMWITNRSIPKGFKLLDAWGFRYITAITWVKPHFGMGNYFRGQTEHVLFGVKGSQPLKRKNASTVFNAPRGPNGHSSKPPEFYDFVESCSPGPYLEMFSRVNRDGWKTWGENS